VRREIQAWEFVMPFAARLDGRLALALCCLLVQPVLAQAPSPHIADTEPLSAADQQRTFHVPPGFEVQLVAAEPEIRKPINLNFDARGRLLVTQSVEYPYPAAGGAPAKDELRLLSQFDADGHAQRVQTLADGLNIPIGVVPLGDGAIVYSIPQLVRLYDRDGDGRAESRRPLYGEFGFRDTHGMCSSLNRWIDGWIYACHGFSNTSTIRGADGEAVSMQSGNTFRLRDDGSHVEPFTHGQVNPFGMCFDPLGNQYVADCHSRPVTMLLRGACYPSFGKPHDGLGFGPEMIRHNHGSTGIAGVVYYAADHFPKEYHGRMFIGNPITNRVNCDRLVEHGSTYEAQELPDFLTCDDPWFRPVDVRLGPDGALYIADFYNRIIGHYEVPLDHPQRDRQRGRIWRVVYRGAEHETPVPRIADLTKLPQAGLLEQLADANRAVRTLATHEIVERFGAAAAEPIERLLEGDSTPMQRAHAMWALERVQSLTPERIELLAGDPDRLVRVHALKLLAERADWGDDESRFRRLAIERLGDADAFVRRAAADALGQHAAVEGIEPLLAAWQGADPSDTHLIHMLRMALRNHLLLPDAAGQLQRRYGQRPAELKRLMNVALGARTPPAAEFVLSCLGEADSKEPQLAELVHFAARYLPAERMNAFYGVVERAAWREHAPSLRSLKRAAQERGAALPKAIEETARRVAKRLLAADVDKRVRAGLELARDFGLPAMFEPVARHVAAAAPHEDLRVLAIDAAAACDREAAVALLAPLVADNREPFAIRQKTAQALGAMPSDDAQQALSSALALAPARVATEIALALANSKAGGERLLAEIEAGKASPLLLTEPGVQLRLAVVQPDELAARREKLLAGLPPRDARFKQLVDARRAGFAGSKPDLAVGRQIFEKNCAICHRLAGKGTKIGPELDGIGQRGLERLLEDVLDPNRNVDQAFRSTLVTTTDGRALAGLVIGEEGEVLLLADAQGKPQRIAAGDIAERAISPLSPMPANVAELLPEEQFYHLLGFLLDQRQAVPAKQP
jgi:putative heme-binding domain-containing protein